MYGLVFGSEEFVSLERRFFVVSDGTDQQTEISDVFLAIANDVSDDNDGYAKFYENKLRTDGGGNIEGKFSVEESLRTDLKVIITTHSKADIEKFELVSPSGQVVMMIVMMMMIMIMMTESPVPLRGARLSLLPVQLRLRARDLELLHHKTGRHAGDDYDDDIVRVQ